MTPSGNQRDPAPPASQRTWVPIRSLTERHREKVVAHLLALDAQDRYLRFGYAATDEQLVRYADSIDFLTDAVFGIFNRRLELIAWAHMAHGCALPGTGPISAEFGVSVLGKSRRRGFGARLFEHAILHARNRGIDVMHIQALSENAAMLHIARRAGATVVREGSESQAFLKLPPDSLASHVGEMVEEQVAAVDYQFKAQALRVSGALDSLSGVIGSVRRNGRAAVD